MQVSFYCTPRDLTEIFAEIELINPLVYEPRFGDAPRITEIDTPLRKPLYSYREFYEFGKACYDTPPFYVYAPEDESRHISSPNLLSFSGPPVSLTDPHILCEGSLFLNPENREESARILYKNIRKVFAKRFIKSGYCFISPCVYVNRREYLFIQREHSFLAPAWCFDDTDQHAPIDIDSWYQMNGKRREQYEKPSRRFLFFSALEDLKAILLQLEKKYDLKYVEVVRQGKGGYQETVYGTVDAFMGTNSNDSKKRELYLYDQTHRMLLYLKIDISWNQNGRFAAASEAFELQNVFGGKLYHDFAAMAKEHFQEIKEPRYGPFYISPILYTSRSNIIFSFDDPYFRIDETGKAAHVWRKEWLELLARWKLGAG